VNGDDAAAAIAVALDAEEMIFVADVQGVEDESGMVLSSIHVDFARELITQGVAAGGMAAKLESAQAALKGGVPRVRICDLSGLAHSERGTLITQAEGVAS
jgi:acetylglutamate kinase